MPIYLKTSTATNSWRKATSLYLKTSTATNSWRKIISAYIKTNDGWRSLFSSIIFPSIETRVIISSSGGTNAGSTIMNDSSPITLTSTRYHWNNADGFTYVWQKSPNNVTWTNIGTEQATTNPASGSSSSSITKTLSASDFTSGSDMYFRFVFYATNSTYGTSNSSESLPILISYYGTPTPSPGSPSITGFGTTGFTAYGNIGTWTNSPTSYDWRWFYNVGLNSGTLTYAGISSVSTKSFSGQYATLTTTGAHGYRNGDYVTVSGVDNLFNTVGILQDITLNSFTYYVAPSNYSLTTAYTANSSFVTYFSNVYKALQNMPTPSTWSSSNSYASGSFVTNGLARYVAIQSVPSGTALTNTAYWQNIAPTNSSYWQLQSFSNVPSSGTSTAPNYYQGSTNSSTSFLLIVPETDYKTGYDLRNQVLGFGVKAYNPATPSPSEYTATKFVYGYPVINLGTPSVTSTSISIPYTQSYMTSYIIDVKYAGSSISGYPLTVSSPSSPITIIGLVSGRTYSISVTPRNGENTEGTTANTSASTPSLPSPPTITSSSSTTTSITLNFILGANSTSTRAYINGNFDGSTASTSYTFLGLSPGTSYSLALFGYNGTVQSSTSSGGTYSTQFGPALTPTFGTNSSTTGGFFGSVTNYDANYTWGISTSAGSVVWSSPSGSTRAFTVSGLSAGQSATVTVTTSRTGYSNGSNSTTGTALNPSYTITWRPNGYEVGSTNTSVTSSTPNTVNSGVVGTVISAPANPTPPSTHTFAGYWRDGSPLNYTNQVNSGGSWTVTATNKTFYAYYNKIIPNISSITVSGNGTAGVTCSAVMTNTFSVEYVLYCRDTTTSAWIQVASGTASANGTSLTTSIGTTSSVGVLPDQYYVTMTPYTGTRSTSGTGGGTGNAGTQRSTIGSPKNNNAGSITVNY